MDYGMTVRETRPDGDGYKVYEIAVPSKGFAELIRELGGNPTPKTCQYVAEWVVDFMTDVGAVEDEIRDFVMPALQDRIGDDVDRIVGIDTQCGVTCIQRLVDSGSSESFAREFERYAGRADRHYERRFVYFDSYADDYLFVRVGVYELKNGWFGSKRTVHACILVLDNLGILDSAIEDEFGWRGHAVGFEQRYMDHMPDESEIDAMCVVASFRSQYGDVETSLEHMLDFTLAQHYQPDWWEFDGSHMVRRR